MVEFLPTSTYKELVMSDGWSEEYLQIAEKFDSIHKRIKESCLQQRIKIMAEILLKQKIAIIINFGLN